MDSDGEDAEGVNNNFAWLITNRDAVPVSRNESISRDAVAILKEPRDSACGSSDDSGEGANTLVKGNSRQDFVTSKLNNHESLAESGAVKAPSSPVLNSDLTDPLKLNPSGKVSSNVEKVGKEICEQLPSVNVPEKIILCFDLSEDQFYLSSKYSEVNDLSTLNVVKQAIEMFIHSKHMIDKRHEFALVVVHQKAVWLQNFTSKLKDILPVLSELTETPPSDSFCLTSLFDVIKENVTLPVLENYAVVPPPYVIRPIIIYSRCQCVPKFNDGQDSFHALMSSKYFGFDYVVIHESLSPESLESDEIANVFSEMCAKPWSLKFHVSRSATEVLDCMAKLLSHPLQRGKMGESKDLVDKHIIVDSNGSQFVIAND